MVAFTDFAQTTNTPLENLAQLRHPGVVMTENGISIGAVHQHLRYLDAEAVLAQVFRFF